MNTTLIPYYDTLDPEAYLRGLGSRDGATLAAGRNPIPWRLGSYHNGTCRLAVEDKGVAYFSPWPVRDVTDRGVLFDLAREMWGLTR